MSNLTPIFRGNMKKGIFFPDFMLGYLNHLRSFQDGQRVELTLKKRSKTKSDPLRKYYFAVVAHMIAEETGHTSVEVHNSMKIQFASYADENGLTIIKSVFSNQSKMKIPAKKKFVDQVVIWAAQFLHLAIPDPGDVEF